MIKENAIALPAVLLVDEASERLPRFRWGVLAAGWLLVAGVYLAARATVLENPGAWEISDWAASLGTRGALALRYLGIAVIPWDLSVFPADPGGAAWIGTAVLLLGAVAMWRSGWEAARRALFGLVWFAAFLAPSLAVRMGEGKQAFFDARLYVPWVGIAIAAASLAACGTAHRRPTKGFPGAAKIPP